MAFAGSALLFGAAHLNPWQFVGAVPFGLIAAWWCLRAGSLVPAIVGHALGNGLPWVADALGVAIPGFTSASAGGIWQPLWLDLSGAVLLVTGLWLARRAMAARTGASPGTA
jgi:membrane protease YdiL (CAAX protease family)